MNVRKLALGTALAAVLGSGVAYAAGVFTPGMPAAPLPLAGTYQIPLDTEISGGSPPQSAYATLAQIAGFGLQSPQSGWRNALIGGDFGTNLWQRGTAIGTFGSITTSDIYGPDRWSLRGGASGGLNISKQTGASDITAGYTASARVGRQQFNVVLVPQCISQEIESANSTRFQGQTAEFSFHALAGSGFSSTNSAVNAVITTGTGTDEGMSGMMAGTWTGQTWATTAVNISTAWNRFSVTAQIPAGATEIGVKLCNTPVGTAPANDFFEFTGAQLAVNPAAVAVTATTGVNSAGLISAVERRPTGIEALLQYRYFWEIVEGGSNAHRANGQVIASQTAQFTLFYPTQMRATPSASITSGFAAMALVGNAGAPGAATQCVTTGTGGLAAASSSVSQFAIALNCLTNTTFQSTSVPATLIDNSNLTGEIQINSEF